MTFLKLNPRYGDFCTVEGAPLRARPRSGAGESTSVRGSAAACAVTRCDSCWLGALPAGGKSNVCAAIKDGCSYHRLMLLHPRGQKKKKQIKTVSCWSHVCQQRRTALISPRVLHRVCENSPLLSSVSPNPCLERRAGVMFSLLDSRLSHICGTNCILYCPLGTARQG